MDLSDEDKALVQDHLDRGMPLPDRFRWLLFEEPREAELMWPGKTSEVTNVVLPFQCIEQIDEPRSEGEIGAYGTGDLFSVGIGGRQAGGWSNKLIWGDNKLVLASLKGGRRRETLDARKSLMNTVAGDNDFELEFARFLEAADDVQAFYKNSEATGFTIEYQAAGGGIIRDYRPDFVVRDTDGVFWIVETKGRMDEQDPRKWARLKLWCEDATEQDAPKRYRPLFVREEDWDALLNPVRTLQQAYSAFGEP